MNTILKFVLDYVWGKLMKEGLPYLIDMIKKGQKKQQINKEVTEEEDEVDKIKKEIDEWLEKHPDATEIPKYLENKLRHATKRRNDRLRGGAV